MNKLRLWTLVAVLVSLSAGGGVLAAEMSAGHVTMRPGDSADVIVSGEIEEESTFAWTVMIELVPRSSARGTVTFTTSNAEVMERASAVVIHKTSANVDAVRIEQPQRPDVDIRRQDDVWPDVGNFTAFDTHKAGSARLNGAVDDNGTLVPAPVSFSGALAHFPLVASRNARGVWDVVLSTSVGASNWEGIQTSLIGGTITVSNRVCRGARDCNDRDPCTVDTCRAGQCVHSRNEGTCGEVKATRLSPLGKGGHRGLRGQK